MKVRTHIALFITGMVETEIVDDGEGVLSHVESGITIVPTALHLSPMQSPSEQEQDQLTEYAAERLLVAALGDIRHRIGEHSDSVPVQVKPKGELLS